MISDYVLGDSLLGDLVWLLFLIIFIGGFIYLMIWTLWLGPQSDKKKQALQKEKEEKENDKEEIAKSEKAKIEREGTIAEQKELLEILDKYKGYIQKFCEIVLRETITKDEWGDEDHKVIPKLKKECIKRIARQVYKQNKPDEIDRYIDRYFWEDSKTGNVTWHGIERAPFWVRKLFTETLDTAYAEYRKDHDISAISPSDIKTLNGYEFETYVQSLFEKSGFNVTGTPKSGDQGADLIAHRKDKTYVIQVKHYAGNVGNKAVQEVVAAKNYYAGDIGVVVTNSLFTKSAHALANRNKIVLIEGSKLENLSVFMGQNET